MPLPDNLRTGQTARLPDRDGTRPGLLARMPANAPSTLAVALSLPPRALSPNSRACWQAKARAVRRYRAAANEAAWLAVTAAGRWKPRWERASVQATFHFRARRRRDGDNLLASLKPAFDGLVDAGLLADDSGLRHEPVEVVIVGGRDREGVILRVTEVRK